jgi:hypothetical protein
MPVIGWQFNQTQHSAAHQTHADIPKIVISTTLSDNSGKYHDRFYEKLNHISAQWQFRLDIPHELLLW